MRHFSITRLGLLAAIAACLLSGAQNVAHAQLFGGAREHRTISTDRYEVSIHRNGTVEVRSLAGTTIFDAARPMVWFEGDNEPRPLPVDGRRTARTGVHDPLGEGQGMVFKRDTCEWLLQTYPGKPFLTVRVAYINTGKRSVRVKALAPWAAATSGRRGVLPEAAPPDDWEDAFYAVLRQPFPVVAGMLTEHQGRAVAAFQTPPQGAAPGLAAWTHFDPPVEVAPGEMLASDLFYLSVAETDIEEGLQRYGYAVAVMNRTRPAQAAARHGWRVGSRREPPTHQRVLDLLEAAAPLVPFGWRNVTIGPGWQSHETDWTPNPELFPEGFAPLVSRARELGFSLILAVDPFVHPPGAVREHAIFDPALPGIQDLVRRNARRVVEEWGFDGIEEYRTPHPLTRLDSLRLGLQALREGIGNTAYFASSAPQPVAAGLANARVMAGAQPDALTEPSAWFLPQPDEAGAAPPLDAIDAPTTWFMHPWVYAPVYPAVPVDLPFAEFQTHVFARALAGGPVTLEGDPAQMRAETHRLVQALLPAAPHAFRPVVFREDDGVLHVFSHAAPFPTHVLAVLRTPEQGLLINVDAIAGAGRHHLVYTPATGAYLGRATGVLALPGPSDAVHVLGLRAAPDHPVVLGTNRGLAGGFPAVVQGEWDRETRTLSGTVEAIEGYPCRIDCFAPEGFEAHAATAGPGEAVLDQEERLVAITFIPTETGKIGWHVRF